MGKTSKILLIIGLALLYYVFIYIVLPIFFETTLPEQESPNGTYTTIIVDHSETIGFRTKTITFSGNTLTISNELDGKRVYTYRIEDQVIRLTNTITGETHTRTFLYFSERDSEGDAVRFGDEPMPGGTPEFYFKIRTSSD